MIAVMWAYEWVVLPALLRRRDQGSATHDPAGAADWHHGARRDLPVVNLAYMLALPLDEIRGVERIAEKAVTALLGPGGARLVAATVVVSTLGCNAAAVIAMSRACYAMAVDGMFFRAAAAVHPHIGHRMSRSR
jgi:amino acid transporter